MVEQIDLTHILFILSAAVLIVPFFQRLGLGSILGYIVAGAIIGPWGLEIITQVNDIMHIAEFGVVFLLFIIGIELNFSRLWAMRNMFFGLGMAQLIFTASILIAVALFLDMPTNATVIIGFGLALSSTAFVLQILSERNELETLAGRTSFSILLLQDLAVVPLLALVSFLTQDTSLPESGRFAFIDAFLAIGAVILFGRFILTPFLRIIAIARNKEVFIVATVLFVLGTAWLMDIAGLSMALGAFLAGLMLADSYYRHQIIADIQPFRGILLGLFFMSVGMSINFGIFQEQFILIMILVLLLLSIKFLSLWLICRLAKINNGTSIRIAMLLSQSGEFGLVLFGLAVTTGLIEIDIFQILTLVIAISMISTPLMATIGSAIEKYLKTGSTEDFSNIFKSDSNKFIVIVGFGRVGRRIAKILRAANISYIALDNDPDIVTGERKNGFSVVYGEASRYDVLDSVGMNNANAVVITIDKADTAEQLTHIIHSNYPSMPIYARGQDKEHCIRLKKAGAVIPVSETLEASLKLGEATLAISGVPENEAEQLLKDFHETYYKNLDSNSILEDDKKYEED